jgi:hypothetical protein
MREHLSSVCRLALALLAGAACLGLAPARAATVIDQTFTANPITATSAFTNTTTGARRAQTLTVGVAGTLSEVDIQLTSSTTMVSFTGFNILSTTGGVPNSGTAGIIGTGSFVSQTSTEAIFSTSLAVTVGEVIAIEPLTASLTLRWAAQNFPVSFTGGQDFNTPPGSTTFGAFSGSVDGFTTHVTTPSIIPLPAALPLFATGLGALGLLGWRRKKKAAALAA